MHLRHILGFNKNTIHLETLKYKKKQQHTFVYVYVVPRSHNQLLVGQGGAEAYSGNQHINTRLLFNLQTCISKTSPSSSKSELGYKEISITIQLLQVKAFNIPFHENIPFSGGLATFQSKKTTFIYLFIFSQRNCKGVMSALKQKINHDTCLRC